MYYYFVDFFFLFTTHNYKFNFHDDVTNYDVLPYDVLLYDVTKRPRVLSEQFYFPSWVANFAL